MKQFWTSLLYQPLLNGLLYLTFLTGNLGWAVVILTVLLKLILLPFSWSSLRAAIKMRRFAPELEKLKRKHKGDKQALAKAQMEFYRQKGINPAGGCLPQIIQILVLIALYQAFRQVLSSGVSLETMRPLFYHFLSFPKVAAFSRHFWYLDLQKPDILRLGSLPLPGIFLLGAAITQFFSSKIMAPPASAKPKAKKEGAEEFAASFQKQSLYLFPLMTLVFGFSFPSGLVLYWFVFSLLTWLQSVLVLRLEKWEVERAKSG